MWWIILALYLTVVVGFLIMMYREAPKQSSRVGPLHYLVALFWPFWLLWFSWIVLDDWWNNRKKKRAN